MDKPVLSLEGIKKTFGPLEILKRADLTLYRENSVAIVGPSGAGKSTLLHIAGLMEAPSEGQIFFGDQPVSQLSPDEKARFRMEKIGFLFQFHYLLPEFSALENVLIPCRLAQDNLKESTERARSILDRLGLSERLDHRPYQLSGGEQQRTALARALIRNPGVLLCDEPTGNLDPETGRVVMDLIWDEIKRHHCGALIVTHNMAIAQQADKAMEIKEGRLENSGAAYVG